MTIIDMPERFGSAKMAPTPGSIAGTKIVYLRGGPPEWDGQVTACIQAGTEMERWDHTGDAAIVYRRTEEAVQVRIIHDRRGGPKAQLHDAEVYEYVGYREEHPWPEPESSSPQLSLQS